jgi:hypothetical protein
MMKTGRHNNINQNNGTGVCIVYDPMPVEYGGYYPGTFFSSTDLSAMLDHCSFSIGTEVLYQNKRCQVINVTSKSGEKQVIAEIDVIPERG